jgi:hypothetical protein
MDIDTSSIIQIFKSQEPITYWNWVPEQKLGMLSKKVHLIQSSLFSYSNINVVLRYNSITSRNRHKFDIVVAVHFTQLFF